MHTHMRSAMVRALKPQCHVEKDRMEGQGEATVVGASTGSQQLKPLSSSKSKVWRFFGFTVDESGEITNKTRVVCRLCDRRVPYSGNTTNLFYHLQTNHPQEHKEVATKKLGDSAGKEKRESARQRTISGCFSAHEAYGQHSARYTQCQNALVEFICKDLQPMSVVDSPSFLQLLSTLDPRYIPASRTTFSRTIIPNKYTSVKASVLGSLSAATHCSLTTDLWTGCHRRAYMSVTVHYITSEWEMKHHCLQTREIEERHTAENSAVELKAALKEWGLECKAYGCTTDNASNIINAIQNHMSLVHLPCIGHTLQLSVERGLQVSSIARVLGRCKKLAQQFHKSTQLTYNLREKQRFLSDGAQSLNLIQSCPTRWGSTYLMLERIQVLQQPLCAVLLDQPREVRYLLPDSEEWTIIEELLAVLKPFHRATTAMSASSYPTLSMLSPLLYKLLEKVLKMEDDDTPSGKALKEAILTDLSRRYSSLNQQEILRTAAFLDPRFKDLDPFVPETERKDVQESVKLEMLDLAVTDESETQSEADTNAQPSESQEGPPPPKKPRPGTVSHFFSDLGGAKSARKHSSGYDRAKSEMDRYIQEPLLDLDDDPLEWWKSRQSQYPLMSQLVRKYWSLTATSVRSEEAFSTAGNVLTKKRNRLLPENVDKLVFLHDNM